MPKKRNPLDEALSEREKTAAKRHQQDLETWQQWSANRTPENTNALMRRFEPVFRSTERQHRAPNVTPVSFRTNMMTNAAKAFENYDPNKGTVLRTHVQNMLRKSITFNQRHQNFARLSSGMSEMIGPIDRATDALRDELGREPTHVEVATYVNAHPDLIKRRRRLTGKKVGEIHTLRRADVFDAGFESDPTVRQASRAQEVLGLLPQELTAEEKQVFNHLYGHGVPAITSTSVLAKKLGKSQSSISRIRTSIQAKFKRHL
jgi:DNA-directed RNA polymerase specialized sigma subunit